MNRVYLDNAASTSVDKRVVKAMMPYWSEQYGNAGGILHDEGMEGRTAIDTARQELAGYINAQETEIVFTSGGTEANNLAILGVVRRLEDEGTPLTDMHIITTEIEHSSVLDIFKFLEKKGVQMSYVQVDIDGLILIEDVQNALQDNTVLVSVMMSNNEIGTVMPVFEIGRMILAKKKGRALPLYFHVDASQAALFFKINVLTLHADLITFDAQKMYGPKGVGFLYKNQKVELQPLMLGGNQEFGLRPGTPNTPLIVGYHKAFELVEESREKHNKQMTELRNYFIAEVEARGATLNGSREKRVPSNINVSFEGYDAEFFVISLNKKGVACSAKSACLGSNKDGSYVVRALGGKGTSSVRFSLSKYTTKKELDFTLRMIEEILKK